MFFKGNENITLKWQPVGREEKPITVQIPQILAHAPNESRMPKTQIFAEQEHEQIVNIDL